MKIIPSSTIRYYAARASVFLITVVLIAGMVGCVGATLTLTISTTDGGSVTTPGEGTFSYFAPQCCPTQELIGGGCTFVVVRLF